MHSLTACLIGGALGALVALEFDPAVVTGSAVYHLQRGAPRLVVFEGERMLALAVQREEPGKTTDLTLMVNPLHCDRPRGEALLLLPGAPAQRFVYVTDDRSVGATLAAAICARRRTA